MPIGDALKNFRQSGYGGKKEDSKESAGGRSFKLSDDEVKGVGEYQPGEQVQCVVTGRLGPDNMLMVTSVEPAGGGPEKEMAAEMMGKPPMMNG